uniref:Uncharacterized protein n=1 Tax=Panagrolaimus sp. PS1159 TaxID=55785 RepID=A0AC35FMI7_9BILA
MEGGALKRVHKGIVAVTSNTQQFTSLLFSFLLREGKERRRGELVVVHFYYFLFVLNPTHIIVYINCSKKDHLSHLHPKLFKFGLSSFIFQKSILRRELLLL